MNTEELKRLAEDATPGPWNIRPYVPGIDCGVDGMFQVCHHASARDAAYIAAANPAAVLELIRQRDELLIAAKDAHQVLRDWVGYIPSSTIQEDLNMLGIAIANAEKSR